VIVLDTSALIELLTDRRSLRDVVAARLLAEEAAGERLYAVVGFVARDVTFR
jgi:predicted nucleic acid-binding protein